jgi:hypothetical protein
MSKENRKDYQPNCKASDQTQSWNEESETGTGGKNNKRKEQQRQNHQIPKKEEKRKRG